MQIVMPMAGEGRRFSQQGYRLPKPLLPVGAMPMVARVIADLPAAERVVLIMRNEHLREHDIAQQVLAHVPGGRIIAIDGLTAGQACTVRVAEPALDPAAPTLVAACDSSQLFDPGAFDRAVAGGADCLIWTFRGDTRISVDPSAWGWVEVHADGIQARRVSCKQTISAAPLNDHAVTGFFWFRSARLMYDAIDRMVQRDQRVNGEFYMDLVPNLLIEMGCRVEVFAVEKYIGWGTPHDYEDFLAWERYCARLRR
ncbi:MAG: NTP transferase domain-containing protein [Planctomycetes bacterium]|nr:NTP transferase domain-containing protein [Planctomycetota bacterium]